MAALAGRAPDQALWLVADEGAALDPWSVLGRAARLVAHGDDEWIALARCAGVAVDVLSSGRFGAPGDGDAALDHQAALALASMRYRDPFTGGEAGLAATIDVLATWRAALDGNRGIAVASGMAWWKRAEIRRFLWHPARRLRFFRNPGLALVRRSGPWRRGDLALARFAATDRAGAAARRATGAGGRRLRPLGRIGGRPGAAFVGGGRRAGHPFRSGGAQRPRNAAGNGRFSPAPARSRARPARDDRGGGDQQVCRRYRRHRAGAASPGRRLVLVPGQVEDDMSVKAGGHGLASNLELVRRARQAEPDAEIWFRPHPDVDAGHRRGAVPDAAILAHADRVVRGGGMAPLLDAVDAVHVLTSLAGFEALMRGARWCAMARRSMPAGG
jgi:capsular polysaccharide export protein